MTQVSVLGGGLTQFVLTLFYYKNEAYLMRQVRRVKTMGEVGQKYLLGNV